MWPPAGCEYVGSLLSALLRSGQFGTGMRRNAAQSIRDHEYDPRYLSLQESLGAHQAVFGCYVKQEHVRVHSCSQSLGGTMTTSVANCNMRIFAVLFVLLLVCAASVPAGPIAGSCVHFRGDRLLNSCPKKIFVIWYDEGHCTSVTGCGDWVGSNGEEAIIATKGLVRSAACFWPETPRRAGTKESWKGEQGYSCSE